MRALLVGDASSSVKSLPQLRRLGWKVVMSPCILKMCNIREHLKERGAAIK